MMIPSYKTTALQDKKVLVRVDFNVPFKDGQILDLTRVKRCLPTLNDLIEQGAKIIILTHIGRPNGQYVKDLSTQQLVPILSQLLNTPVKFLDNYANSTLASDIDQLQPGEVAILENLRFHLGEENDDIEFAKQLSMLGDIYINDGFAVSHRAHASVHAITKFLPSFAGLLFIEEVTALHKSLDQPERPLVAIVGGAKVSSKLQILENLVDRVDILVLGGGIANTFLKAKHYEIGASLFEPDMIVTAKRVMMKAQSCNCEIIIPSDVVVADDLQADAHPMTIDVSDIKAQQKIFDIGPRTVSYIQLQILKAKTLVWNGPVGVFEIPPYDAGTRAVMETVIAQTQAGQLYSLAGGGETVAAIKTHTDNTGFSYLSTAGGAFLEWLEGRQLPGIQALEQND